MATSAGVFVADTANNRLLAFALPQSSSTASAVIGQLTFTDIKANQGAGDASASTLQTPEDLAAATTELVVADTGNNRVLVFGLNETGANSSATRVIGQVDFPYTGVNMVDAKGFSFASNSPAGAVLDSSVTPARLYVPDTFNNRILGYSDFAHLKNGQAADIVIGQPDFNRAVINYASGDSTTPNSSGLYQPTSLAVDSAGNVYVTDAGNGRVLRFPAPFASGRPALEAADLVIGQSSFPPASPMRLPLRWARPSVLP